MIKVFVVFFLFLPIRRRPQVKNYTKMGNFSPCHEKSVNSQPLMKAFFQNIAFWAIYGTWYALSLLPMWMHYLFSDILYLIVAYVLHYRHRVVWKNLRKIGRASCRDRV